MKKILVVDNDRTFLMLMTRLLVREGHLVETADGGLKALDMLKSYHPDVIFLDLVMPNIDGKTLCRIIRSFEKFKAVPIVILSGVSAEDLTDVSRLGVNACIAKGAFNETAPHVLAVINDPDLRARRFLESDVRGIDNLRPRGITRELLSIQRHFKVVLERMSEGIFEINAEGRIIYANTMALSLADMPEKRLLSQHFVDLFIGDDAGRVAGLMPPGNKKPAGIIREPPLVLGENRVTADVLAADTDSETTIIIVHDVTEQQRAEERLRETNVQLKQQIRDRERLQQQLIRSERLAAAGQLAASVAHEINSPLQAVTVILSQMADTYRDHSELPENIELLKTAFGNIRQTVRYLLDLSRPQQGGKEQTDINDTIEKTVRLVRGHLTKSGIGVRLELSTAVPSITASPQQLSHLFLNLINNAVEAISEDSAGRKASDHPEDTLGEIRISTAPEGTGIVITVADTGPGIPVEDLHRIFDPFYSSKKATGLGIGLANCHRILENHGGTITAANSPDGGAVFVITLPQG